MTQLRCRVLAIVALALWLVSPPGARAQPLAASLIADAVTYDRESGILTAAGNVEILYSGRVLRAQAIIYEERAGRIRAEGPLVLTDPSGAILVADEAALTPDLAEGLVLGARLLIENELQLAANEVRRVGGRYNALYRVVASSCEVCAGGGRPTWAIRAQRVTQDEQERRIHFENATLEIFGLPVAWLPYLRIPDPSVNRASGLLTPRFLSSEIFGFGVKQPYYRTLGRSADLTLTPFVTTEGSVLLEGEYRRRFARGGFDLSGVYAFDDGLGDTSGRGAAFATGSYAFENGFVAEIDLAAASDRTFLRQFDYTNADQLTSVASLARTRTDEQVTLRSYAFQTLREKEDSATIPFVLPDFGYRRIWGDPQGEGRIGLGLNALGVTRPDGTDMARIGGHADWTRSGIVTAGIVASGRVGAELDAYVSRNEPGVASDGDPEARVAPSVNLEARYPFLRTGQTASHVIEPIVQIAYSDILGTEDVPNEDSLLPNFDETNLFALNRFPGLDRIETGLRANVGLGYNLYSTRGWTLGAVVGRVFRAGDTDQFPEGLGLNGRRSDFVSAVALDIGEKVRFLSRSVFDDSFTFAQSELGFRYQTEAIGLELLHTYRRADDSNQTIGPQPETNAFAVDARYRVARNWEIGADWRYDLAAGRNIFAGGEVTYGNECAELNLSVSRRFTSSDSVPPTTSVGFSVRLAGLGAGRSDWPAQGCGG